MRHISNEVGARAALLYQEIRRCLGLRGGRTVSGTKWIYKTMSELSERFGFSVRDIQRHLKRLVDLGWLKRERLDAKKDWDQTYWYSYGEVDPFTSAKSCPVREWQPDGFKGGNTAGSSSSSRNRQTGGGRQRRREQSSEQQEQPCAHAPDAEATQKLIKQQEALVVGDPVKGLQQAREMMRKGDPSPRETAETQVETSVVQSSSRISPPSPGQSQLPGKDQPHPEQASSAICGSLAFDQLGVSALAPDRGLNQPYPPSFSFSR